MSNADIFGTFLKHMNQPAGKTGRPEAQQQSGGQQSAEQQYATISRAFDLVVRLASTGPLRVAELQSLSKMPYADFSAALLLAEERGFIDVGGEPGAEICRLTPKGTQVVDLAR